MRNVRDHKIKAMVDFGLFNTFSILELCPCLAGNRPSMNYGHILQYFLCNKVVFLTVNLLMELVGFLISYNFHFSLYFLPQIGSSGRYGFILLNLRSKIWKCIKPDPTINPMIVKQCLDNEVLMTKRNKEKNRLI